MATQMTNRSAVERCPNHKIIEHSAINPISKYCKPAISSLFVCECISCLPEAIGKSLSAF